MLSHPGATSPAMDLLTLDPDPIQKMVPSAAADRARVDGGAGGALRLLPGNSRRSRRRNPTEPSPLPPLPVAAAPPTTAGGEKGRKGGES